MMSSVLISLILSFLLVHAGLTEQQKVKILAAFNEARSTTVVPAANMRRLVWDDEIAAEMQAYTDLCDIKAWKVFKNPPANFMYRDRATDPVGVARWRTLRMAPYFDYQTGNCIDTPQSKRICRHPENYEKVVFAGNEKVGCGVTICGAGPHNVLHACGAAPNSKYEDSSSNLPWISGPRCSKCPVGFSECVDGLCTRPAVATIEASAQDLPPPVVAEELPSPVVMEG